MPSPISAVRLLNSRLCQVKSLGILSQTRNLNLLEYQSKALLAKHGVTVQRFKLVSTEEDAENVAKEFPVNEYVIKAQILAGGRGVGVFSNGFRGGVHLTEDPTKVKHLIKQMLGHRLITKQTRQEGILVSKVMVAESVDIKKETYVSILLDRAHNGPVIVISPEGGVDIEAVAEKTPEAIKIIPVDIYQGLSHDTALQAAEYLKFSGQAKEKAVKEIKKLWDFFLAVDAIQVEINPLAESKANEVVAIDAKIIFDDNAQFRQKHIFAMADTTEIDPRELQASKSNLNYIALDGNIGCLVNGAGLAMATMDIIKLEGGEPANFLDIGGNVREDQITEAFKLLTNDKQVKGILVNVFGGIVNCAIVASGIVSACKTVQPTVPVIVRLEGNNVQKARAIIKESGLQLISAVDMENAVKDAIVALKE